jgi:hypothetical protein
MMLNAEFCQTNPYERDNLAAALPALLVLRQQVLQFEDGLGAAAARAILAYCHDREWSDRGARLDIDG